MLGIDKRRDAAQLLGFGDDMKRERRLAGRLRSVQLGHATARDTPHSKREVQQQRAGWDDGDLAAQRGLLTQLHDCALPVALDDLGHRRVEGLLFFLFQCRELPPRWLRRVLYVVELKSTSLTAVARVYRTGVRSSSGFQPRAHPRFLCQQPKRLSRG